jgi:hypothetical protein
MAQAQAMLVWVFCDAVNRTIKRSGPDFQSFSLDANKFAKGKLHCVRKDQGTRVSSLYGDRHIPASTEELA